jgi:hypothetical protein
LCELVVNLTMASDILDEELENEYIQMLARKHVKTKQESKALEMMIQRATVVLEHIMCTSNQSLVYQHWQDLLEMEPKVVP